MCLLQSKEFEPEFAECQNETELMNAELERNFWNECKILEWIQSFRDIS